MEDLAVKDDWSRKTWSRRPRGGVPLLGRLDPVVTEKVRFLAAFLRRPAAVGAVAPSSASLAQSMLRGCNLRKAKVVVELGPGTGAFTRFILQRIGPQTHFLGLELDRQNAQSLLHRFPGARFYNDSAENLPRYLPADSACVGFQKADCIISGLPWGSMSTGTQDRILEPVFATLKPGGVFTAMAYIHATWLPSSRYFRRRLEGHFKSVSVSPIVWRNLPPAIVYRCR